MGKKVVIATLPTMSREARDEIISKLTAISKEAQQNEAGTLKYAILVPRDESDDKTIWVIEEYTDKPAFDLHMNTEGVQDLIKYMSTEKVVEGAPNVRELEVIDGMNLARTDVTRHSDPYIAFAELEYKPGSAAQSIPYWKQVVETSRNETGTLVYGLHKDPVQPDKLYTLEVYESKDYLWDVHAKSDAVAENVKNTKDLRIGLKHSFLKYASGFLHK